MTKSGYSLAVTHVKDNKLHQVDRATLRITYFSLGIGALCVMRQPVAASTVRSVSASWHNTSVSPFVALKRMDGQNSRSKQVHRHLNETYAGRVALLDGLGARLV